MIKNAFYFSLKPLFVLKIFKFLSWLFDHREKLLDLKDKVDFNNYDVRAWLTNNCNGHIANITRSKGNQTMKIPELIEHDMRNVFLENLHLKCEGEAPPFSKKSNGVKLSINIFKSYVVCFYCTPSLGLSKYIETKPQTTSFYLKQRPLKNKKRSGAGLPASFYAWFFIFLLLYSTSWPNFVV